jgi:plasmid maintenance system killer protein
MAIVKDNILLQLVRGTIGKQLTIYERNGQIIMAKKRGPSKKKPTQKQLEARLKMTIAAARAQVMMADPEVKAYYASLAGPGQNAYNIAVKDAYRSPEVQNIRLEDQEVVVTAKNEFRVAAVRVEVINAEGRVTESGPAILGWNGIDWHYKATALPAGGKVIVVAENLPGYDTVKELMLT